MKAKFQNKLLVEGNDDKHVMYALFTKLGVSETFDIVDCEGVNKLIDQIPVRLKQSGIRALGILLDADFEIERRWRAVKNVLESVGFILPDQPGEEGTIIRNKDITIGIWLMPNNRAHGMLEDFVSYLLPLDDRLMPHAELSLEAIEKNSEQKYIANHKSKAKIHTWLSWQEDPGTPLGLAITKKYLDSDKEVCSALIKWINSLFNPETP